MKGSDRNYRRALIIIFLFLFNIGCIGMVGAEDPDNESGTRGCVCIPMMGFIEPRDLVLQPGENATCTVIIETTFYNHYDFRIWLEGVPRIITAELERTNFTYIRSTDRMNTTLKVSIPESSPVNVGVGITIHGYATNGNYTLTMRPIRLTVTIIGPDLCVMDSAINISEGDPVASQSIQLTALISNVGEVEASNIPVRFFIDGDPIGNVRVIDRLAPGESYRMSETWTATPGDHLIFVKIDPDNAITEYSEGNNTAITAIYVDDAQSYRDYVIAFVITIFIAVVGIRLILKDS